MNIIVLAKQVPNSTQIKIDPVTGAMDRTGVPAIMNPDDKAALEFALRIKDETGAKISVLTMGLPAAKKILFEAIAMGADEGVLLTDRACAGADTLATSKALAAAIKYLKADLVIGGRQAIDGDTAQVGPQIAEHLHLPQITYAQAVKIEGDHVIAERRFEDRIQTLKAKLPAVITCLGDAVEARYMNVNRLMNECTDDKIKVIGVKDIDLDPKETGFAGSPTKVANSFGKVVNKTNEIVEGTAEEVVESIIAHLKDKKLI